jgi:hypothetical protein
MATGPLSHTHWWRTRQSRTKYRNYAQAQTARNLEAIEADLQRALAQLCTALRMVGSHDLVARVIASIASRS